jgi:hypothetical protein
MRRLHHLSAGRRLESLGAITRGDRRAGADATLRAFSLEHKYAEIAVLACLVSPI